jgi:guanyl-specific ribonuclease Sa
MLKSFTAIAIAATIAAVATALSAPTGRVDADPLPQQAQSAIKDCTQRPWPYANCVGTRFGNPKIRLVTTDRLPGGQ